jgi:hypothetical protein
MLRCKVTSVVLLIAVEAQPSLANAEHSSVGAPAQPSQRHESADASASSPDDAEALYADARRRYDAGDLRGALEILQRCYAVAKSPNLLFNIAQVHHELSDCPAALEFYQRYVQDSTDGERRDDANQQIAILSKQCPPPRTSTHIVEANPITKPSHEIPTAAPVLTTRVREPASERPHHWSTVGWIALGAGTLAGVATAYFSAEALQASRDTERKDVGASYHYERAADLTRESAWAWACGVTTVVAVGTGIYALTLASPKQKPPPTRFSMALSPQAALVDYRLLF